MLVFYASCLTAVMMMNAASIRFVYILISEAPLEYKGENDELAFKDKLDGSVVNWVIIHFICIH
jgi:hypothetical protein